MDDKILDKLNDFLVSLENNYDVKVMKNLKNKLVNDKELMSDIEKVKNMDNYSSKYLDLKKKILDNKEYKEYKNSEKKVYFLVQEMNQLLKEIRVSKCENN